MDLAKRLEELAKQKGVQLLLPTDVVIADKFDANANSKTVKVRRLRLGSAFVAVKRVCRKFWG